MTIPKAELDERLTRARAGLTFHVQSWFTNTSRGDDFGCFVSNTVLLSETGCESPAVATPGMLQVR